MPCFALWRYGSRVRVAQAPVLIVLVSDFEGARLMRAERWAWPWPSGGDFGGGNADQVLTSSVFK